MDWSFRRFSFYQFSKHEDNNFGLTNSKNVVIRFEKNISVKLHFILSSLNERFYSIVYCLYCLYCLVPRTSRTLRSLICPLMKLQKKAKSLKMSWWRGWEDGVGPVRGVNCRSRRTAGGLWLALDTLAQPSHSFTKKL